jgi:hypothetical protein
MKPKTHHLLAISFSLVLCLSTSSATVAHPHYQQGYVGNNRSYRRQPVTLRQYFADHPKVKATTVGAGVGAAAGAVTGLVTGRGVLRGTAVGAGTGAGVGLVRSSNVMKRHPIVKDVATGSLVGMGIGYAGGRNRGTTARATAVGAAAGLATGLLKHGL